MQKVNAIPGASTMHPLVYYITRSDRPGLVKIGTTTNIGGRLSTLKGANELTLLGVEIGGLDIERARHGQFAAMRADGEWFIYGAPIIYHLMQLDQDPVTITRSTWYATTTLH